MLPLQVAWTYEEGLPSETRTLGFGGMAVPINGGTGVDIVYSSTP